MRGSSCSWRSVMCKKRSLWDWEVWGPDTFRISGAKIFCTVLFARVSGNLEQIFLLQSFLRESPDLILLLDYQFLSILRLSNSHLCLIPAIASWEDSSPRCFPAEAYVTADAHAGLGGARSQEGWREPLSAPSHWLTPFCFNKGTTSQEKRLWEKSKDKSPISDIVRASSPLWSYTVRRFWSSR